MQYGWETEVQQGVISCASTAEVFVRVRPSAMFEGALCIGPHVPAGGSTCTCTCYRYTPLSFTPFLGVMAAGQWELCEIQLCSVWVKLFSPLLRLRVFKNVLEWESWCYSFLNGF